MAYRRRYVRRRAKTYRAYRGYRSYPRKSYRGYANRKSRRSGRRTSAWLLKARANVKYLAKKL